MAISLLPVVWGDTTPPDFTALDAARIWTKKAVEYENTGMYNQAVDAYYSAVQEYPAYSEGWSGMGSVLIRLGRYREALIALDQAIALDPRDSVAWYHRGVALGDLQRYAEARESLDKSLQISPNNSQALIQLGDVDLNLGEYQKALNSFTTAVSVDPTDGSAYAGLGQAQYLGKNLTEAENSTRTALSLYPDNLQAWKTMADIAREQGKSDWSDYYHRTAEEIGRYGVTMPEYAKALALQRMFAYDRSLPVYDSAIRQYPKEPMIWTGRGEVLKYLGRFDDSLRSYEQAVLLDPQNVQLRMQRDLIAGLNQ